MAKKADGIRTKTPLQGFAFSCIACCSAEACTMPIDVVKTRLQLQGELGAQQVYRNAWHAATTMVREEGPLTLFRGITPALLRQATYGTLRYGSYEPIKSALGREPDGSVGIGKKVLAGTITGAFSSALCNPTDLVKVRMQAEITSRPGHQPRYRGTWHAFRTIASQEGVKGLYRGVGPTCGRAAVGAAAELATYDEIKSVLVRNAIVGGDNVYAHFGSSLCAGFIATVVNSPFDVVKSRVMNQPTGPDGRGLHYRGMIDCFAKSARAEGVGALWKGFWPNYARVGPRVVIIFMVLERLRAEFS